MMGMKYFSLSLRLEAAYIFAYIGYENMGMHEYQVWTRDQRM
ncbi:MAG: hypothetical protein AB3K77_05445 [Methanosarcinaceae archaeon]